MHNRSSFTPVDLTEERGGKKEKFRNPSHRKSLSYNLTTLFSPQKKKHSQLKKTTQIVFFARENSLIAPGFPSF